MEAAIRIKTTKCQDCYNKPDALLTEVIRMDPENNNGNLTWDSGYMAMLDWRKAHKGHQQAVIEDIDYEATRL